MLADSLQGYPLEWCTRNEETADSQLKGGDFHVYYSEDSNGIPKVPRLAIRMNGHKNYNEEAEDRNKKEEDIENNNQIEEKIYISEPISGGHTIFDSLSDEQKKNLGLDSKEAESIYSPSKDSQKYSITKDQFILDKSQTIAEIRGIESGQNIDQFIQPVLDEKLKEFGKEGKIYLKKSEDMKEMTKITEKHRNEQVLNIEDLKFVYEIDSKIEGFGFQKDPRIKQILDDRNTKEDLRAIFNVKDDDNELALCLINNKGLIEKYINFLDNLNYDTVKKIIEAGGGLAVADNINKFKKFDQNKIVLDMINANQDLGTIENRLKNFDGFNSGEIALKLLDNGICHFVAHNLDKFKDIDCNKVALKIIKSKNRKVFLDNFDKFEELDSEVALELFNKENTTNFGHLDPKFVVDKFKANINKFKELNLEVALLILENKNYHDDMGAYFISNNFEKFKEIDHSNLALKVLELTKQKDHSLHYVVYYEYRDLLNKLNGFNSEVALKVLEFNDGVDFLKKNFEKFNKLDSRVAIKFIQIGGVNFLYQTSKNLEILVRM